jgi:hypothetical protein
MSRTTRTDRIIEVLYHIQEAVDAGEVYQGQRVQGGGRKHELDKQQAEIVALELMAALRVH